MLKRYMLPGLQGIYRDYLEKLPQTERFLGRHYSEEGVFAEAAGRVASSFGGDRSRLAAMLQEY
ncbi:MAG: hypothetical protein SCM57_14205, partial [Bacillota bacterium]|nr:hypothetical protein [Bacillota bacterium]